MKLKVCGVRNMAMLQACQDLSVPYIGFNFVPTSKRVVDLEIAQSLSHAYTGKKVGVFQNQNLEEITHTTTLVDLDIIQLHGEEDVDYIQTLKTKLSAIKPYEFWKALSVQNEFKNNELQQYSKNCDLILFDGSSPGSGTQIEDKNTLKKATQETLKNGLNFAIAGGINRSSVPTYLELFPEATLFDTASGVETNGAFDRKKLEALLQLLSYE